MSALICGSLAFDKIANYESRFSDAILPNQLHILNVSFFTPELRQEFGGCAGNIAYTYKALGGEPIILAAAGVDSDHYLQRFQQQDISIEHIQVFKQMLTAQCFIITDRTNNQINAFHPGAMNEAHQIKVPNDPKIKIGIISPDGRQAMLDHAQQMYDQKTPFIFDPGQGLPMFNGEELKQFLQLATWVALNDYESELLLERTELSLEELVSLVPNGLFITRGEQGSDVWEHGNYTHIDPTPPETVLDPTGCGDAYRAGLLYGLERDWGAVKSAQLGSQLGAIKVAMRGPQNHKIPANLLEQFSN